MSLLSLISTIFLISIGGVGFITFSIIIFNLFSKGHKPLILMFPLIALMAIFLLSFMNLTIKMSILTDTIKDIKVEDLPLNQKPNTNPVEQLYQ
jgi:hypothetical protein